MSSDLFDDFEDEEEEEDFVPEDYDDEGDDYVDQGNDEEDDPEDFPSVLHGEMFMDETKGLCYEQDGVFCLVCKTSIADGTFSFEAPVIGSPLVFAGWISDPNRWMEFEVRFSKEQMSKDPLQIQLLEAQEQKQMCNRSLKTIKTDSDHIDDNLMAKKSPPKGNLKSPPAYAVKEDLSSLNTTSAKCSPQHSPLKSAAGIANEAKGKLGQEFPNGTPPCDVSENDMKSTAQNNMIFVVAGSQIGTSEIDDVGVSFRGAYRRPSKASVERIYLICPIQTQGSTSTSAAGGTAAVAAASKKRIRSESGDDDSVERNAGVAYQELIDLHDDSRLSTEELRKRYYGIGDKKGESGKKYATDIKRLKGGTKNKNFQEEEDDEDDDDDAYGF